MSLFIIDGVGPDDDDNTAKEHCWWVGRKLPRLTGRVITFQADGDELVALLRGLGYEGPIRGERIFTFPAKKTSGAKQVPPYPCEKQDCKVCESSDQEDTIPGNLPAYGGNIKLGIEIGGSISMSLGAFRKVFAKLTPPWKRVWDAEPIFRRRFSTVMPGDRAYDSLYELFLMDTSTDEVRL